MTDTGKKSPQGAGIDLVTSCDISAYRRFDLVWPDLPSVSDSSSEMDA